MGAMRAGASAEEAVRLCIEFTVYAAGEVQVEHLGPVDPESPGDESEIGFEIAGWPEESPGPSPDLWKDKQGLK